MVVSRDADVRTAPLATSRRITSASTAHPRSSGLRHSADAIEQIAAVQPVGGRYEVTRVQRAARRRTGDLDRSSGRAARPARGRTPPLPNPTPSRSIAATSVERCHGKPQIVVPEIRDVAAARVPQAVGVRRRLRSGVRLPVDPLEPRVGERVDDFVATVRAAVADDPDLEVLVVLTPHAVERARERHATVVGRDDHADEGSVRAPPGACAVSVIGAGRRS